MSLRAQIDVGPEAGERRSSSRRTLKLEVEGASASASQTQVVIHDLSEDGLLVESPVSLEQGETIVTLISDDNFRAFQRTLLLEFTFTG